MLTCVLISTFPETRYSSSFYFLLYTVAVHVLHIINIVGLITYNHCVTSRSIISGDSYSAVLHQVRPFFSRFLMTYNFIYMHDM